MIRYWKVGYDLDEPLPYVYESFADQVNSIQEFERTYGKFDGYLSELDALEHLRRDLMLLGEEIEDKLLDVRQEIHKLKGER